MCRLLNVNSSLSHEYVVKPKSQKNCAATFHTAISSKKASSFIAIKYTNVCIIIISCCYKQQQHQYIITMKATTTIVAIAASAASVNAFVAPSCRTSSSSSVVFMSESETTESAFVADVPAPATDSEDKTFDAVEKMGKGAAKIKRGKKKDDASSSSSSTAKAAATLAPEETFYEGPPAITETIAPTISILTVVGIVPAAAAWARQAWVRYRITNRRIRVTSGIGGKDMAEIVYPDVVELRTVKRLFGDGDMVFFLRDGAKFEMRNVPNFEETIEFILGNVDKSVRDVYRSKGDVGAN